MADKICFAYYFATMGGVERVFLNRSEALLRRYPEMEIDFYFTHDCGGIPLIERYCKVRNLDQRLRVVRTLDSSLYRSIFVVDTPQLLVEHPAILDKVLMECHTAYTKQRTYLQEWQNRLKALLVPSPEFQRVVGAECPALRGKIKVVRNFVPHLPKSDRRLSLPAWRGQLFFYFGRIDEHKNLAEFIDGVSLARQHLSKGALGIICGQIDPSYSLMGVIEEKGARESVVTLPPVPFENTHILMQMLRERRAAFVSCSKGESFGLAAAEAMTAGLPVILSDIPPHAALVANRAKFLYRLGDARDLAGKMAAVEEQYDELSAECVELSREFSEEAFLADWERLFPA